MLPEERVSVGVLKRQQAELRQLLKDVENLVAEQPGLILDRA